MTSVATLDGGSAGVCWDAGSLDEAMARLTWPGVHDEPITRRVLRSARMPSDVESATQRAHVGASDLNDAALARRASAGSDRAAEAELCRRFAPRIRLYGLKHLRDQDRSRDLVQAVLAAVIEALRAGRVEDFDLIDRFMLGTARNLSARFRDQDGRAVPMAPNDLPDLEALVAATESRLDVESLLRCMKQLEMRAQTVIHLSFYRDKQADEIASVLETTAGNVRVLRHRAIAQLRDCMAAKEAA